MCVVPSIPTSWRASGEVAPPVLREQLATSSIPWSRAAYHFGLAGLHELTARGGELERWNGAGDYKKSCACPNVSSRSARLLLSKKKILQQSLAHFLHSNMPRSRKASVFGLLASGSLAAAGTCDVYASGGTPCVAAHSTTRSLYNNYNGALYQVTRASDGQTKDIKPRGRGGVANSNMQDGFCQGTSCTITVIYDQSGHGNDLSPAPPGGAASGPGPNGYDVAADASAAPVYVNGQKAYGVV